MPLDRDYVTAKRDGYVKGRTEYLKQAQAQIASYNGAVAALDDMLAELDRQEADTVEFVGDEPEPEIVAQAAEIVAAVDAECDKAPADCGYAENEDVGY